MHPRAEMFRDARAKALARGDHSMAATMAVELERMGYKVTEKQRTAKRRGRPPKEK